MFLHDIVNPLCIYIQSQFQVVDSPITSLLTSLVNNINNGNPSLDFINTSANVTNGGAAN